jgi:hypothetical protein
MDMSNIGELNMPSPTKSAFSKQKLKSEIHLLNAFENVYKAELKNARTPKQKQRFAKKLSDISLARELKKGKLGIKRRDHKLDKPKRCLMCGEPTRNESGFCDAYTGSSFGCKEQWYEEYKTKPTNKELNAKWRDEFDE